MNVREVVTALIKGPGHIVVDENGNPRQISKDELCQHEAREAAFRRRHGIKEQGTTVTLESILVDLFRKFL